MTKTSEILVEVTRGGVVESVHRGHLAVIDGDGELVASLGDPETVTFARSSAKPFQAMPFLLSGAAESFGFTESEIALACGSHNGEPFQVETAAQMLAKAGNAESDLRCGAQEPYNEMLVKEMIRRGEEPTQLHNNCSGKHAAMLAFARYLNAPTENYIELEHPIQQAILANISKFSEVSPEKIATGVDGCSAPNFAFPLVNLARMYAKLVAPPKDFDDRLQTVCRRVATAMMHYPEMIGGSVTERLDTLVMQAAPGLLVSKIGAEGVYTAGVVPNEKWRRGLGIALKIEDGNDKRARPVAVFEIFRQLEILNAAEHETLKPYAKIALTNHRKIHVGDAAPNFSLKFRQ